MEVVYAYTKRNAVEDGLQVALSGPLYSPDGDRWVPEMVREAGFKIPVYITTTAFGDCVSPIEGGGLVLAPCQDIKGRLWDVLWMLGAAIRRHGKSGGRLLYRVYVCPNIPRGSKRTPRPKPVQLLALCGPDDDGSPCITICYPDED